MSRAKFAKLQGNLFALFVLFGFAVLNTSCSNSSAAPYHLSQLGTYEIDPVFLTAYNYYGGEKVFGQAISPSEKDGFMTIQYLEKGKFIFDKSAPISSRFRLAPLGVEMAVREPDVPVPQEAASLYIGGHTIDPVFYPLYNKLGADLVGKPLTGSRYNLIRQRKEQLFENVGFFIIEGDTEVHLLSYGIWACGDKCSPRQAAGQSAIDITSYIDPAFDAFIRNLGADFSGFALSNAYQNPDGSWEQIFENVVLVADSAVNPEEINLLPLSKLLDIRSETPMPRSGAPDRYFYAVEGKKGYEIPTLFYEYIENHGGIHLFGAPITHYSHLENHIYHQCFTYLCLIFDPTATGEARVRPEPLGYAYRVLYGHQADERQSKSTLIQEPTAISSLTIDQPPTSESKNSLNPLSSPQNKKTPQTKPILENLPEAEKTESSRDGREITLRIWQRDVVINQAKGQEIEVWVIEDGKPLINKAITLSVKMPNDGELTFQMPPTGWNGQTSLLLPEIDAMNGTIIPFKACYQADPDLKVCVSDIFVVWDTP